MTDRELLETLAKVSERCRTSDCEKCKFSINVNFTSHYCAIAALGAFLSSAPCEWDFIKIEKLLEELGE